MTKHELVDHILQINHSAEPEFLLQFNDRELQDYLRHLQVEYICPRPCSFEAKVPKTQPAPGALAVGEVDEVVELKEQKWAMPMDAPEKPEPQFKITLSPVTPVGSLF